MRREKKKKGTVRKRLSFIKKKRGTYQDDFKKKGKKFVQF